MPTVNEKILDELTGHSVDLMRVDAYMRERVITELRKLQRELTSKLEQADLPGYTRTSYQRKRTRELLKQTEETISNYYQQIAAIHAGMLDDVAGIAEVQVVSAINAGVSASVASVAMSEKQLVAIAKNTLIQGAPSAEWWGRQGAYLQMQFEDKVRSGLMQGLTTGQIVQSIRGTRANQYRDGIIQASKRSAENLVRTSVQAVANEARMQTYDDNDDIIKAIEWVSTLDSRTSDICRALDGLTWKPGTMKPIGHNKKFPGPTAHWNCVVGGTEVSSSGVLAKFARRYSGEVVDIVTASGNKLTCTINHPVLTTSGFVTAGSLKKGMQVISASPIHVRPSLNPDDKQVVSCIEDTRISADCSSGMVSVVMPIAAEDFHGDVANHKVGIVTTNRKLWDERYSKIAEMGLHGGFKSAFELPAFVSSNGRLLKAFLGWSDTSHGIMCRFGKMLDLIRRRVGHSCELLFRPVSEVYSLALHKIGDFSVVNRKPITDTLNANPTFRVEHFDYFNLYRGEWDSSVVNNSPNLAFDDAFDGLASYAELAGNIINGSFGNQVFSDDVTDLTVREVDTHVYNLETELGFYVANGIVTHNCRSTQTPVLKSWDELGIKAKGKAKAIPESTRASMDGQVPESLKYEDWLKTKPKEFQVKVLGPGKYELWKSGKLGFRDMVDQSGNPLPLEVLKAKLRG